jgi:ribosome-associated toxin RatA of RatAB toxin-antitoxin module
MPYVQTEIDIAAPRKVIYELAKDMERYSEFMPDVEYVKILRRDGNKTVTRWKTLVEDAPIEWTEEDIFDDERTRIDYRLTEGDLDRFEGAWTFEERDGMTHVVLGVDYDFGVPTLAELIGPILQKKVEENSLMMLRALKAKSEGPGRSAG